MFWKLQVETHTLISQATRNHAMKDYTWSSEYLFLLPVCYDINSLHFHTLLQLQVYVCSQAGLTWNRAFWKCELKLSSSLKLFIPMYLSQIHKNSCQPKHLSINKTNCLKSIALYTELICQYFSICFRITTQKEFPIDSWRYFCESYFLNK